MKKTFIKNIVLGAISLVAIFGVAASTAFAASTTLNQDAGDLKTVRVSNYSAVPGSMTWTSSVNSAAGQIVSVGIYYHNSGSSAASNLTLKLNPQTSGSNTSHTFTATVTSDNSNTVTDTATVNVVGGAQSLTYIPTAVYWYPNQECKTNPNCQPVALPSGQDGSELFSGGLNLGTIAPGWSSQGGLTVQFKVSSSSNPNNGQAPTVSTTQITNLDDVNGAVTLNGYYNSNGASTTTSFQYRQNGGAWITVGTQSRGISNSTISYPLTGLSSGSYEYQAVATNSYGTSYGQSVFFTVQGGSNIVCPNGTYGTYPNCIPNPVNVCPSGTYGTYPNCYPNPTQYCPSGTTGTYPNCIPVAQNCGNGYWNGSYCVYPTPTPITPNCGNGYWNGSICIYPTPIVTTGAPTASTLGTISVGGTVAAVDGYYTANGCDAYTSFRYGTSQSLGSATVEVDRGNASGSMAQSISGLSSNTTYYYEAVVRNCVSTAVGSIRSFQTTGTTINDTTITHYVDVNTGGGGNSFIKLMIDNHRETVGSGRDITYDVSWENLTTRTLKKLVLEVNFPTQMAVVDTDHGSIERNKNAVVYQIDSLGSRESGTMQIVTDVNGNLKEGDPVVAQAIMAFENPTTSATENAIAYDADTFSANSSVLGASLFGLDFLPNSLIGWLIILLILLVIVILAHSYITRHRVQTTIVNNHSGMIPNIPVETTTTTTAGAPVNDYVVYRPTPKP